MQYRRYLSQFFLAIFIFFLGEIVSLSLFLYEPKDFYFRPWEYFDEIAYRSDRYPATWSRPESSDLTRGTFFLQQEKRPTQVTTDKDGYRSNLYQDSGYDILISGDSTIFGSSLSDHETLPWQLSERLQAPVFNAGRAHLYRTLLRPELANTKIVIDCVTERNIDDSVFPSYPSDADGKYHPLMTNDHNLLQLIGKIPPQRYSWLSRSRLFLERITSDLFISISNTKKERLFMQHSFSPEDLQAAAQSIQERSKKIQEMGMAYIFIGIPAKQTLYADGLDEFTKHYLTALQKQLSSDGVESINLIEAFQQNREANLFHAYDSHWNARGVEVAANVIADYLTKQHAMDFQSRSLDSTD